MKLFAKLSALVVVLAFLSGCSTPGDDLMQNRLPPPESFNAVFMRYQALQEEKVLVIAVDPGGRWAFGYDHSRESLAEAAERAAVKCDRARNEHQVFTKGSIFAINDEIVYYEL